MTTSSQDDCKCNIQNILDVYEKLDSLTQDHIDKLLCTFDRSCKGNVEFSEFSNEVLFDVLSEAPNLFVIGLNKLKNDNLNYLIVELENPINDKYLPKDLIKIIDSDTSISQMVIEALKVAQSKY